MLAAPSEEFDPTLPGLFAGDPPAEFVSLLEAIATAVRPESLRTQLSLMADADQRDLLPDILVPTLLIWGELDARSSLSVARQFEHAIPDTKLVVIPDCGHVSNLEQPNSSTPPYASSAGPTRRGRRVRECRMSRKAEAGAPEESSSDSEMDAAGIVTPAVSSRANPNMSSVSSVVVPLVVVASGVTRTRAGARAPAGGLRAALGGGRAR